MLFWKSNIQRCCKIFEGKRTINVFHWNSSLKWVCHGNQYFKMVTPYTNFNLWILFLIMPHLKKKIAYRWAGVVMPGFNMTSLYQRKFAHGKIDVINRTKYTMWKGCQHTRRITYLHKIQPWIRLSFVWCRFSSLAHIHKGNKFWFISKRMFFFPWNNSVRRNAYFSICHDWTSCR